MREFKEEANCYYELTQETILKEREMTNILKDVYHAGFKQGIEWANNNEIDNPWHKKTKDGWTNYDSFAPPRRDLIVTVYEDNCDNPYYYTTSAWYLDGYWIKDNDVLNGVVAWKEFSKPCKEK